MANPSFVQGAIQTSASTTFTITLGAVTNGILIVQANIIYGAITGITWDGAAMTRFYQASAGGGGDGYDMYWIASSDAKTSKDIVVSNGGSSCLIGYMYFQDAAQQAPTNVANSKPGSGDNPSQTITCPNDSMVAMFSTDGNGTYTAGANTTRAYNDPTIRGQEGFYSTAVVSGGSKTLNATGTYTGWNGTIMSIEPVPASAIKTVNDLAKASVKTKNGLAIASVKTINGLA